MEIKFKKDKIISTVSFLYWIVSFYPRQGSRKFPELRKDAKDGGNVAGATRKDIEAKLVKSVVSSDKYLEAPEKIKRLENKKKANISEK